MALRQEIRQHWPRAVALLALRTTMASRFEACLQRTQGHWCYPPHDTFIHRTIASNLARYGVWGHGLFAIRINYGLVTEETPMLGKGAMRRYPLVSEINEEAALKRWGRERQRPR